MGIRVSRMFVIKSVKYKSNDEHVCVKERGQVGVSEDEK